MKKRLSQYLVFSGIVLSLFAFFIEPAFALPGDDCVGAGGEVGFCQLDCTSWTPGGVDYYDVGGTDCGFGTSCCSEEGKEIPPSDTCINGSGTCENTTFFDCTDEEATAYEGHIDCSGNIAQTTCCVSGSGGGGGGGGGDDGTPDPKVIDEETFAAIGLPDPGEDGIQKILIAFLNWLLIIFLIASLIAFVLTGLMYLLAMGNSRSDLMDRAKKYFVDAIIALFVTGSGLIIINVVNDFLKGDL